MPKLKARSRMPRPDDSDIIKTYCQAVAQGHPLDTAATLAGIGATTARDWIIQGEQALAASEDGELRAEELGSHAVFARSVKQAEADFVSENLTAVHAARDADHKNWPAAMTLLERRRPRDFGRQQYLEVETHSTSIQLVVPLGALPALERLLGRQLPAGGTPLLEAGDPAQGAQETSPQGGSDENSGQFGPAESD